jgi:hypothetical protein
MRRRDLSKLMALSAGALMSQRTPAQSKEEIRYPRTAAEIAARITPSDYGFAPLPIVDVRRYGFDQAGSAERNTAGIESAIGALPRVSGVAAGTVQLPPGVFAVGSGTIDIPQFVALRGAGMHATVLQTGNDGRVNALFRLGGPSTGVLKHGCGLSDLAIILTHRNGKAVECNETCGAYLARLYIECEERTASRTGEGVRIDGGYVSSFFNILDLVHVNHLHVGFRVTTTGNSGPTQQVFRGCIATGDVATDKSSVGLWVETGGSGSVWHSGNLEICGDGMRFSKGCQSMSIVGARFEANTRDVDLEANISAQSFIGCLVGVPGKVRDSSRVSSHRFVACVNENNQGAPELDPGQTTKRATAPGQCPLIIEGYPGDTTAEELLIRNSAGQRLFSITNEGRFARINNAPPATISGSRGGNAALRGLLSVLASYGLIVDNSSQ